MRSQFTLFQSHLDLAHSHWEKIVKPGDTVIDATCGNGQDTLILCQLALEKGQGFVYAVDIQEKAINHTRNFLIKHLCEENQKCISYQLGCHSIFPNEIPKESVTLIAYNLGYLPGCNKRLTTMTDSTLRSLKQALKLIRRGGAISITCYPGHHEGFNEQEAILNFIKTLSPSEWSCCQHVWLNRLKSPSLVILQRALGKS